MKLHASTLCFGRGIAADSAALGLSLCRSLIGLHTGCEATGVARREHLGWSLGREVRRGLKTNTLVVPVRMLQRGQQRAPSQTRWTRFLLFAASGDLA